MPTPISWDLDVTNDKALIAFDEAIRAMQSVKAQGAQLAESLGGVEKVAEEMGITTAQAAKLIEKSVQDAAKAAIRAQQEAAKATERAAKEASAAAVRAAKEAEAAQIAGAKEAEKALERLEKAAAKAYREQQKEAERAARAQEAAQRRIAAEAEKTARTAGNSWNQVAKRMQSNQLISDLEQLGGAFIPVGGAVSKVAMTFTSLVRPVAMAAEMLGPAAPLALGLAAIPVLAAGVASALFGVADAATKSAEELAKLGQNVSQKQAQQLGEYAESSERLQIAMDKLWVTIGAPIADQLADIVEGFAEYAEVLGVAAKAVELWIDAQAPLQDFFADRDRALHREAEAWELVQRATSASLAAGAKAAADAKKTQEEYSKTLRQIHDESMARDKAREEYLKGQAEKKKKAAEDEKKAQEQLDKIIEQSMASLLTAEGKIYAARDERIAQIRELKVSEEDAAFAIEAATRGAELEIANLYAEREKKRADADKEWLENTKKTLEEMEGQMKASAQRQAESEKEALKGALEEMTTAWLDFAAQIADLRLQQEEEELESLQRRSQNARDHLTEQWEHFREVTQDMSAESRKAYRQQTKADRDETRQRIDLLHEEKQAQKQAVREAFAVSQAAAVAQTIMQGALAYMGLLANLAASLGPGAIAAPAIAAGIVGPAVGAQLATIASQKAPAHDGRVFGADEFYAGPTLVRDGERGAVLNQRAVESGATRVVEDMNRGKMPGSSGSATPASLVLVDSGRVIGEAVVEQLSRPETRLARAVGSRPRGYTDPFRRRR